MKPINLSDTPEQRRPYRLAFVMQLKPGKQEEYRNRHNPIWPELEATLKSHGAHNYSIFLHPKTSQLFAYVEAEDAAEWKAIAGTEVCKRWWAHMRELMAVNSDNSPCSTSLPEVFHLD